MFSLFKRQTGQADLIDSKLFSDGNFYPVFQKDLQKCQREVIIESPFITQRRLAGVRIPRVIYKKVSFAEYLCCKAINELSSGGG